MTETTEGQPAAQPFDVAKRIGQYLLLRDKIKENNDAYAKSQKPLNDMLDTIGNQLLGFLAQTNAKNTSADGVGTAYKITKNSFSLEDPKRFRDYVIGTQLWDLANWSAAKEGCEGYFETYKVLPEGVKIAQFVSIGVRRASDKADK